MKAILVYHNILLGLPEEHADLVVGETRQDDVQEFVALLEEEPVNSCEARDDVVLILQRINLLPLDRRALLVVRFDLDALTDRAHLVGALPFPGGYGEGRTLARLPCQAADIDAHALLIEEDALG